MPYGTLSTIDTLRSSQQTVAQYGEDRAFEAISTLLAAHNTVLNEMLSSFVEKTTDRMRRYGGADSMEMQEVDEFGTPDAQKVHTGASVAFPMQLYALGINWTRHYLLNASVSEIMASVDAARTADIRNVQRAISRALFIPTNYIFRDKLVDHVDLPIKALANGDGDPIPAAPDGTTFDGSTHSHYLAFPSVTDDAVGLLIETVLEHFLSGKISIYIHRAQEKAFSELSKFAPIVNSRIIMPSDRMYVHDDVSINISNRQIGFYDNKAEVYVKPWIPAGYILCMHEGGDSKTLCFRSRTANSGDLELLYENEQYPLRSRAIGREFGIGVYNRIKAAVAYIGGTDYVAPNL